MPDSFVAGVWGVAGAVIGGLVGAAAAWRFQRGSDRKHEHDAHRIAIQAIWYELVGNYAGLVAFGEDTSIETLTEAARRVSVAAYQAQLVPLFTGCSDELAGEIAFAYTVLRTMGPGGATVKTATATTKHVVSLLGNYGQRLGLSFHDPTAPLEAGTS